MKKFPGEHDHDYMRRVMGIEKMSRDCTCPGDGTICPDCLFLLLISYGKKQDTFVRMRGTMERRTQWLANSRRHVKRLCRTLEELQDVLASSGLGPAAARVGHARGLVERALTIHPNEDSGPETVQPRGKDAVAG